MHTRLVRLLALLACALIGASAVAGEDPAAAAESLRSKWRTSDEAARKTLLDPVAAWNDPRAFTAVADAAQASCDTLAEAKKMRERITSLLGEAPKPGAAAPDPKERESLEAELKGIPATEEKEQRGLALLTAAGGRIADSLPDAALEKLILDDFRADAPEPSRGYRDFLAGAFGASKKDRTANVLLAAAADALKAYRKQEAGRGPPAKKMDELNKRISDQVNRFLKKQQEAGDFSATLPLDMRVSLDPLYVQREALGKEVEKFQNAMEEADKSRVAARKALGAMVGSAQDADRERLLDFVEKRILADSDLDVKAFGLGALGVVSGDRAFGLLKAATADPDLRIVVAGLDAMGDRSEPQAIELLAAKLKDPGWRIRASAALALSRMGIAAAVPPLIAGFAAAEGRTLDDVRDALKALTGLEFPPAQGPWQDWWDKNSKTFRGPKDPPLPTGAVAPAPPGATGEPVADNEGMAFYGVRTHSVHILFVLDFSGSMNFAGSEHDEKKKKVDVLREELKKALTALPAGATFDLIGFASDVRVWKKEPAKRDAKTLADALAWADKSDVVGSTNIYDALETAFHMMGVGLSKDKREDPAFDTVFFMTDGTPTSGKITDKKLILGEVRRWNDARKVRINVIGMGGHVKPAAPGAKAPPADDVDPEFLKALADQNGGQCVIR